MLDPELLKIMCCPETHQPVALAEPLLIEELNRHGGQPVMEKIDGGLVREDGKCLYPIRGNIPIMLIDEAIPLTA